MKPPPPLPVGSPAGVPEEPPVPVGGTDGPPLAAGGRPKGGTWPAAGAVGVPNPEGTVAMAQQARRGRRREVGEEGAWRKEKAQDLIS